MIKYFAIGLAMLIICSMVMAVVKVGEGIGYMMGFWGGLDRNGVENSEWVEEVLLDEAPGVFETLSLDLKTTSVQIRPGERFGVKASGDVIEVRQNGKMVMIEEKGSGEFWNWPRDERMTTVTVPAGKLKKLELNAGAGRVLLEGVKVEILDLELGAGKTELSQVVATSSADIDAGVGLLTMKDAVFNDLDLDMGVGKVELSGKLTGSNTIEAGVGKLEMKLAGDGNDYQMKVEKGLGALTLNGVTMNEDAEWGNAGAKVNVHGGVGAIEIEIRSSNLMD